MDGRLGGLAPELLKELQVQRYPLRSLTIIDIIILQCCYYLACSFFVLFFLFPYQNDPTSGDVLYCFYVLCNRSGPTHAINTLGACCKNRYLALLPEVFTVSNNFFQFFVQSSGLAVRDPAEAKKLLRTLRGATFELERNRDLFSRTYNVRATTGRGEGVG